MNARAIIAVALFACSLNAVANECDVIASDVREVGTARDHGMRENEALEHYLATAKTPDQKRFARSVVKYVYETQYGTEITSNLATRAKVQCENGE